MCGNLMWGDLSFFMYCYIVLFQNTKYYKISIYFLCIISSLADSLHINSQETFNSFKLVYKSFHMEYLNFFIIDALYGTSFILFHRCK